MRARRVIPKRAITKDITLRHILRESILIVRYRSTASFRRVV
jgi:hypothetical protein